jgi:hypothetical protein
MNHSEEDRERSAIVIGGAGSIGPAIVNRLLSKERGLVFSTRKPNPGRRKATCRQTLKQSLCFKSTPAMRLMLKARLTKLQAVGGRIDYSFFARRCFLDDCFWISIRKSGKRRWT